MYNHELACVLIDYEYDNNLDLEEVYLHDNKLKEIYLHKLELIWNEEKGIVQKISKIKYPYLLFRNYNGTFKIGPPVFKESLEYILTELILNDGDKIEIEKLDKGFEITYGNQYDPPELSLDKLKELAELFGTEAIDVDNYSQSGCESCDWESDYGHTIQVYYPTKSVKELEDLVGKGNLIK